MNNTIGTWIKTKDGLTLVFNKLIRDDEIKGIIAYAKNFGDDVTLMNIHPMYTLGGAQ